MESITDRKEEPASQNGFSASTVETVIKSLSSGFERAFPANDLLFSVIGSYNRDYRSNLFSDVDIFAMAVEETNAGINLEILDRLCLTFKKVSLNLEKENVFLVGFGWYATQVYGLDLAKYNLALKRGYEPEEVEIIPINLVFFSTTNSYFFRHYELLDFWREERGNTIFILGKEMAWETFEMLHKRKKKQRIDNETIEEIQEIINHMEISYIEFRANAFIPHDLLAKESIRNVSGAVFNAARIFLRENKNPPVPSFEKLNEEIEKLPVGMQQAIKKINEVSSSEGVLSEEKVLEMYRTCTAAVNGLCYQVMG